MKSLKFLFIPSLQVLFSNGANTSRAAGSGS
jgi:hypothetical protein